MSGGSNSAERILAILDLFTEERLEWTPEALMAELGYSRPTLYRYLKTLKEAGFLTSLGNTRFTLGPRVVELDFLMRKSDPLVLCGQPVLARLARRYPCAALLVRWYGDKLLCVASDSATPTARSSYPRGRPMPLARGAISRAILAFLPRRQQVPLIEGNLADFAATGMGGTPEDVVASLRRVRRDGTAVAHAEVTPGVIAVAAPVLDTRRAPMAALCATLARDDVRDEALASIRDDVRGMAEAIGRSLAEAPAAAGLSGREGAG